MRQVPTSRHLINNRHRRFISVRTRFRHGAVGMATKVDESKVKSDKEADKDELAALDALEKEASEFNKVSFLPRCRL